ncbi:MAG TPA: hypothetical protein VM935_07135, partial [Chitinophagaceae bacterium]|nr:hypothetical protein [Chitinophagaceae bacterium]
MKKFFVLVMAVIFTTVSFGQNERESEELKEEKVKGFQKENLFVGGNFGLTFGNFTLINVSPQIGYRFNRYLAAGTGLNLQYISIKEKYTDGSLYSKTSQGVTGLNVFGRVYPIRQFMLQVQPEANYVFGKQIFYDSDPRQEYNLNSEIVPSLLMGGGLVLPSGRGAFIASVFYDVLQKENSPYGNRPILNFTYNIGL